MTNITKTGFYFFLLCITSVFFSCKKGTLMEGDKFVQVSIPFIFDNKSDSIELYIDGKYVQSSYNSGTYGFNVIVPQKEQLHLSIFSKGKAAELNDTTVTVTGTSLSISYAYNTSLGFNQFVKPGDFDRPSGDSIAFVFINKFIDMGSGKISVSIYRNNAMDFMAYPEDSITVVKDIPFGKTSEKIVLPYKNEDGSQAMYLIIVRDAVSGIKAIQQYSTDFGLPENYGDAFINAYNAADAENGKINGISIVPFVYDVYTLADAVVAYKL